jgi:tetratricopeptide (TPR) repeat protein
MNNDIAELKESVRKIAVHQAYQSKISKWSFVSLMLVILIACGISIYWDGRFKDIMEAPKDVSKDWYDVAAATRKGDLKKALHIADELLLRTPLDFDGHYKKGEILLMMGSKEEAKKSFQTAARIFPMPKYKIAADAISTASDEQ